MSIILTEHQEDIKKTIMEMLHADRYALLSGISGTGKSTTTQNIIEEYKKNGKTVWISATTHKAVEVISRATSRSVAATHRTDRISTIHSFLNLIRDTTQAGAPLVVNYKGTTNNTDLLVIDEYSMLTEEVITALKDYMETWNTHVLFVGDASQLILNKDDLDKLDIEKNTAYLTKPMRQGEMSDLAMYSKMTSAFILKTGPEPAIPWGDEIIKYTNHEDFVTAWKQSNEDDKCILAYKNQTVKAYNNNIAKFYREQDEEYEAGNKVILRSSVSLVNGTGTIPNRSQVIISNVIPYDGFLIIESDHGTFQINKTKKWLDDKTQIYKDSKDWRQYYSVRNSFVQVHHADAMTTHSAQGETFNEVFIDASDMMTSPDKDVGRLAYVAISRARNRVHVYVGSGRNYKNFKKNANDIINKM